MISFITPLSARVIFAGLLGLLAAEVFSQSPDQSQQIEVTFNKTSSIIFPSEITAVDRGSRDVLAQKVKGVNNILQLKAGRANFKETNLTVITSDGILHHFFIRYADRPGSFTIHPDKDNEKQSDIETTVLFKDEMSTDQMKHASEEILAYKHRWNVATTSSNDMKLSLCGIYIRENTMFYHVTIKNNSNIPFHTDMLRFYVKDKKKPKRTASQEVDEHPIYHLGNPLVINGKSTQEVVYALAKFTIPDAKTLHIELMEKKGGRHQLLKIKNKSIIKASPVPEF